MYTGQASDHIFGSRHLGVTIAFHQQLFRHTIESLRPRYPKFQHLHNCKSFNVLACSLPDELSTAQKKQPTWIRWVSVAADEHAGNGTFNGATDCAALYRSNSGISAATDTAWVPWAHCT